MVCYLIVNPDPRTPGNFTNLDGRRGFLVKLGDGELGDRYQVHNPTAYGVQNRNHRRDDKFRHSVTGNGIRANKQYALAKALEYQYFKWDDLDPARTEWHKVAEVGYGMTLEDIRQKLVRALELFPSVIYGSNLDSCSPQEFDDLMEEIGSSEVSR
ncbi:hypothetical protein ASPSYDRAFT_45687 [Aspergillus sydowii CBS 593.65]|uniref:Uncharacterized protein n=1 Tax=Aspergillus sydowii CBS 593.65 TaxID=1036612 RepID=A0A1L9TIL0_9EURO|nr:uncharacterized protein ASPSYDRAFT_45687 [Aspergillus sydowii CBS 593.65]OJJ59260.1 hypothetical protein ASPSYDRAFT_45687 [Aspergillus sydowii CBS 593.65]